MTGTGSSDLAGAKTKPDHFSNRNLTHRPDMDSPTHHHHQGLYHHPAIIEHQGANIIMSRDYNTMAPVSQPASPGRNPDVYATIMPEMMNTNEQQQQASNGRCPNGCPAHAAPSIHQFTHSGTINHVIDASALQSIASLVTSQSTGFMDRMDRMTTVMDAKLKHMEELIATAKKPIQEVCDVASRKRKVDVDTPVAAPTDASKKRKVDDDDKVTRPAVATEAKVTRPVAAAEVKVARPAAVKEAKVVSSTTADAPKSEREQKAREAAKTVLATPPRKRDDAKPPQVEPAKEDKAARPSKPATHAKVDARQKEPIRQPLADTDENAKKSTQPREQKPAPKPAARPPLHPSKPVAVTTAKVVTTTRDTSMDDLDGDCDDPY